MAGIISARTPEPYPRMKAGSRLLDARLKSPCFFLDNQRSVTQLTHPSDYSLQKSDNLETRRGRMAPKPTAARLAYVFGMVLAVAAIILGITTRNLAAPSASLIYRPDLPLLY